MVRSDCATRGVSPRLWLSLIHISRLWRADHERPELTRRVGLALNASGATASFTFAAFQNFSRHIVPFSPSRVKESVLSVCFHELHDGLSATHLSANGWSANSYLELISNADARGWWAQCIGAMQLRRDTQRIYLTPAYSCLLPRAESR